MENKIITKCKLLIANFKSIWYNIKIELKKMANSQVIVMNKMAVIKSKIFLAYFFLKCFIEFHPYEISTGGKYSFYISEAIFKIFFTFLKEY